MKIVKKIGTIIISVLLWCVILVAALYAFTILTNKDEMNVSSIAGYTPMVVKTDSMVPEFYSGDLIFIKKTDTSALKVGDVVCFHTIIDNEYALNTHRIAAIDDSSAARSYTTKGDNNEISDTHVISDGDIVGKYVGHLPKAGKLMDFLSSSLGFMIVIVLPLLLFFIYQVYHLIMVSINLKKAVALETEKEKAEALAGTDVNKAADEANKAKEEAEQMLAEAKRLRDEAAALKANTKRDDEPVDIGDLNDPE